MLNFLNARIITGVLTTLLMILGLSWFYYDRDFEPALAAIGGILTFFGFFQYSFLSFDKNLVADRIALIVGNQDYYTAAKLTTPLNDVEDVCKSLRDKGFKIIKKVNPKREELIKAIDDFQTILSTGGVGLFYYAGHAAQIDGRDMILPIDFQYTTKEDVVKQAIDLNKLLAPVDKILDEHPENNGSMVIYSTASGGEAFDYTEDNKKNSPFADIFIKLCDKWNLEIFDLFRELCQKLGKLSKGHQVPWMSASLNTQFYFKPIVKEKIGIFKILIFDACRNNPFHGTSLAVIFDGRERIVPIENSVVTEKE